LRESTGLHHHHHHHIILEIMSLSNLAMDIHHLLDMNTHRLLRLLAMAILHLHHLPVMSILLLPQATETVGRLNLTTDIHHHQVMGIMSRFNLVMGIDQSTNHPSSIQHLQALSLVSPTTTVVHTTCHTQRHDIVITG